MKKLLLLLASGLIVSASNGQQAAKSVVFNSGNLPVFSKTMRPSETGKTLNTGRAASSYVTAGWFDYDDTVFSNNITTLGGGGATYTTTTQFMWPDTTAVFGYDNGGTLGALGYNIPSTNYSYNTSIGILFQPFATDWYTRGGSDVSRPYVTTTNAFTIDSVAVIGTYMAASAAGVVNQSYTDSLVFSFVYGTGDTSTNMEWEYFNESSLLGWYSLTGDTALSFPAMFCDTTAAAGAGAAAGLNGHPAPVMYTVAINKLDTSLAYLNEYSYGVNVPVPAGNFVGASVSFKTGSNYPNLGDSITSEDGSTYYYGSFSPGIAYDASGTTYNFPPYLGPTNVPTGVTTDDVTTGFYKTQGMTDAGWQYQYVPNWAQSSTTSSGGTQAFYQQFPMIWFHIQCATCTYNHVSVPVVTKAVTQITAFPVPATTQVNVAFRLSTSADEVTVTLTNLVGQTVATQKVSNVSEGTVQFNTSVLSDGMYFYTVNADGAVNTGRIVVAH